MDIVYKIFVEAAFLLSNSLITISLLIAIYGITFIEGSTTFISDIITVILVGLKGFFFH